LNSSRTNKFHQRKSGEEKELPNQEKRKTCSDTYRVQVVQRQSWLKNYTALFTPNFSQ